MFTLKLYRWSPALEGCPKKQTKVIQVHEVIVQEIGQQGTALELWAFMNSGKFGHETYYIGEPEKGMLAFGKRDLHLDKNPGSWWGWGLLENDKGVTSEHYRPASYG